MAIRSHSPAWACTPLVLALALSACGPKQAAENTIDSLDAELTGNSQAANRDPAVNGALQDQIMVDPTLTGQANNDAVRPPQQPYSGATPPDGIAPPKAGDAGMAGVGGSSSAGAARSAPAPGGACPQCRIKDDSVTLGALARRQSDKRTAGCARSLQYSTAWAQLLPADLPLYPDARVNEAAGSAGPGCALRVVSFSTASSIQSVLDWYYGRVTAAGYSAEHQADDDQHVLGGTRGKDGAAYVIYFEKRGDGRTEVDLVANNGR